MVDATYVKGLSSMLHVDVKVGRVISVLPLFNFAVLKTCMICSVLHTTNRFLDISYETTTETPLHQ